MFVMQSVTLLQKDMTVVTVVQQRKLEIIIAMRYVIPRPLSSMQEIAVLWLGGEMGIATMPV
jgi:hypothetical protein